SPPMLYLCFYRSSDLRALHSFPTRRSSDLKGRYPLANPSSPRPSFILVYQSQLSIRGQGASMPLATRLESSKRCYWLWQTSGWRSEEHTSELQSRENLVCRLLLEKKKEK